jgi:hypothetical protein
MIATVLKVMPRATNEDEEYRQVKDAALKLLHKDSVNRVGNEAFSRKHSNSPSSLKAFSLVMQVYQCGHWAVRLPGQSDGKATRSLKD